MGHSITAFKTSTTEAAAMLGVSPRTMRRWVVEQWDGLDQFTVPVLRIGNNYKLHTEKFKDYCRSKGVQV